MWLSDSFSSQKWFCFASLCTCLVLSTQLFARITLTDTMPVSVQRKTGVENLSYQQKLALEQWLNDTFVLKNQEAKKKDDTEIYLSQNINNGQKLELSDGSIWEVMPDDVNKASFWIVPFPLEFIPNEDPIDQAQYPQKILNRNTGVTVKVKMITPPNPIQPEPVH